MLTARGEAAFGFGRRGRPRAGCARWPTTAPTAHANTPIARHPSSAWLARVAPRDATTTASAPSDGAARRGSSGPAARTREDDPRSAPQPRRAARRRGRSTRRARRCTRRSRGVAPGAARAGSARSSRRCGRVRPVTTVECARKSCTSAGALLPRVVSLRAWRRPAGGRARWRWASGSPRGGRSFARAWLSRRSARSARSPRRSRRAGTAHARGDPRRSRRWRSRGAQGRRWRSAARSARCVAIASEESSPWLAPRGVSVACYSERVASAGSSSILALAMGGGTLVAGLAATAVAGGEARAVARASVAALVYALAFAATRRDRWRWRRSGVGREPAATSTLLAVLVLPELLAPWTGALLPRGWRRADVDPGRARGRAGGVQSAGSAPCTRRAPPWRSSRSSPRRCSSCTPVVASTRLRDADATGDA